MQDFIKTKIIMIFPNTLTSQPVSYNLVKIYDLRINILKAHVNFNIEGKLLIELEGRRENIKRGIEYIHSLGITVDEIGTGTSIDFDRCINCGACVAACVTDALLLRDEKLVFDSAKCMECMLCAKACPQRIIKNVFDS